MRCDKNEQRKSTVLTSLILPANVINLFELERYSIDRNENEEMEQIWFSCSE